MKSLMYQLETVVVVISQLNSIYTIIIALSTWLCKNHIRRKHLALQYEPSKPTLLSTASYRLYFLKHKRTLPLVEEKRKKIWFDTSLISVLPGITGWHPHAAWQRLSSLYGLNNSTAHFVGGYIFFKSGFKMVVTKNYFFCMRWHHLECIILAPL